LQINSKFVLFSARVEFSRFIQPTTNEIAQLMLEVQVGTLTRGSRNADSSDPALCELLVLAVPWGAFGKGPFTGL
jgi:hypothetical protein